MAPALMKAKARRFLFPIAAGVLLMTAVVLGFSPVRPSAEVDSAVNPDGYSTAVEPIADGGGAVLRSADSFDAAKRSLDPAVFRSIGARSYEIVRTGDARLPGSALEYVENLIPRAVAGDHGATFLIYLAILECRNYMRWDADNAFDVEARGGVGMAALENAERKLMECESLSKARVIWEGGWLELAAEQGSVEAKLLYSIDVNSVLGSPSERLAYPEKVAAWKGRAIAYLEDAAGTGNLDALMRLSNAYEKGILIEKNREKAYAYALAANRVKQGSFGSAVLRSLEKDLSMKQRESARSLSYRIYDSCCTP